MAEAGKLTLHDAFANLPDPRRKHGRRHSLQAILSMTVAAMLSGCKGVDAISQWGRVNLVPNLALFRRFGFTSFTSPCPSTLHKVFSAIDVAAVERILAVWVEALLPESQRATWRHISLDGKTLRGTLSKQVPEAPGVHLLSAFLQTPGCTLRQIPVDCKTNEPKAALELLAAVVLENVLVVGDAIFCQKELCAEVLEHKGDYFFTVKDNQPTLKATITEAFETPVSPLRTEALAGRGASGGRGAQARRPAGAA
jgi:hypothetical protein